jgi:hypothetical protein
MTRHGATAVEVGEHEGTGIRVRHDHLRNDRCEDRRSSSRSRELPTPSIARTSTNQWTRLEQEEVLVIRTSQLQRAPLRVRQPLIQRARAAISLPATACANEPARGRHLRINSVENCRAPRVWRSRYGAIPGVEHRPTMALAPSGRARL